MNWKIVYTMVVLLAAVSTTLAGPLWAAEIAVKQDRRLATVAGQGSVAWSIDDCAPGIAGDHAYVYNTEQAWQAFLRDLRKYKESLRTSERGNGDLFRHCLQPLDKPRGETHKPRRMYHERK